jgi:hypothetical protein
MYAIRGPRVNAPTGVVATGSTLSGTVVAAFLSVLQSLFGVDCAGVSQ